MSHTNHILIKVKHKYASRDVAKISLLCEVSDLTHSECGVCIDAIRGCREVDYLFLFIWQTPNVLETPVDMRVKCLQLPYHLHTSHNGHTGQSRIEII